MSRASRDDRRGVVITGAGVLSPLGHSPQALHRALLAGESGLSPVTSFDPSRLPRPLAGELTEGPEAYLGDRNLRPLDRTARLAAATAELALQASGFDPREAAESGAPTGLVLGTMFGSLRTISEFDRRALTAGPQYTKPFDFANSVINAAAGQAAIWHGLSGVNATVGGGSAAGLSALAHGADLIRSGRSVALLAGGAEELCFETCWGLARAGLLCGSNGDRADAVAVPFHARRGGFLPAEGAALLMLEEQAAAERRGAAVLGRITGSGGSFDPSRGRDPERGAAAVRRAVEAALADAGVGPEAVDFLSASASGSRALDTREAAGLAAALGPRAAELPVTAVKGALGESLGAAGALQTVVALSALGCGELPGIAGLDTPEPGLPLALAGPDVRCGSFHRALVTALAWDGPVWALVVEGPGRSA